MKQLTPLASPGPSSHAAFLLAVLVHGIAWFVAVGWFTGMPFSMAPIPLAEALGAALASFTLLLGMKRGWQHRGVLVGTVVLLALGVAGLLHGLSPDEGSEVPQLSFAGPRRPAWWASPLAGFGFALLGMGFLALHHGKPLARPGVAAIALTIVPLSLTVFVDLIYWFLTPDPRPPLLDLSPISAGLLGGLALALGCLCLLGGQPYLRDCQLSRLTLVGTTLIIVASLGLTLVFGWYDGVRSHRATQQDLANISRLMGEHLNRTLDPVQLILLDMVQRVERQGLDTLVANESERQRLKSLTESLPQLRGLVLFDHDGKLRFLTEEASGLEGRDFDWREFFQSHAMGVSRYLGRVIQTQLDSFVFTYSVRLHDTENRFTGVALAALDIDYFRDFYRTLALGPEAALSLVRRGGRPLVREPLVTNFVNRDLGEHPIFADLLPRATSGNFYGRSPYQHQSQLIHYRAPDGALFAVNAALSLAPLRAQAQLRLMGALLLLSLIITLVLALARSHLKNMIQSQRRREMMEERRRFSRAVIDAMATPITVLDQPGRIIDVNSCWPEFVRGLGLERPADDIGSAYRPVYAVITGCETEELDAVDAGIAAVAAGERNAFTTLCRVHRNAEVRWFNLHASKLADGSGAVVVSHEDVTELKQAELAAQEKQQHIAEIAATVPGVLYQWYSRTDGETGFHYLSPRTQEIYGVTPQKLERDWIGFFHPDDRSRLLASIETAVTNRARWEFVGRALAKDGTVRWTRTVSTPVHWNEEEIVYTGVTIDVTTEHQAKQALAESEQRYRALIEGSVQAIVVERIQDNFKPLFVNEAAAHLFGYESVAEAMAEESWAHLIPDATREAALEGWRQLIDGHIQHIHDRTPHWRRDGSLFWVELTARKVEWQGEPALQLTMIDVTERHSLEVELERLATTDPLTGLLNRREFTRRVTAEIRRCERYPQPLSAMMLDIDHFKRVNDTYGHAAGDLMIQKVATIAAESVRGTDLIARFGGEEFAVVLLSDQADATVVAERIRQTVEHVVIEVEDKQIKVTLSIGLASYMPGESSMEPALHRADQALYAAKDRGRNRVEPSESPSV